VVVIEQKKPAMALGAIAIAVYVLAPSAQLCGSRLNEGAKTQSR
jgi:hypothetical protein